MQQSVANADELRQYAATFVGTLAPGNSATVVTLSGELGAGKTTFVQAAAAALGVQEVVTSPTFVLEKIYQLSGQKFEGLIHIDAYRLHDAHELEVLGWRELLMQPSNLVLLEWPERVAKLVPNDAIALRIDIDGDGRIISIDGEKK